MSAHPLGSPASGGLLDALRAIGATLHEFVHVIALFAQRVFSAIGFASKHLEADPKCRVRYRTD